MVAITTTAPVGRAWPPRSAPRHLELIPSAPPRRRPPAAVVYLRRRLLVAAVIAASVVVLALVATNALHAAAGDATVVRTAANTSAVTMPTAVHDLAAYGAGGPSLPQGATYVVRPGDTLWSIAAALHPDGDVRDAVDALAALNGGPVLRTGQVLRLR